MPEHIFPASTLKCTGEAHSLRRGQVAAADVSMRSEQSLSRDSFKP